MAIPSERHREWIVDVVVGVTGGALIGVISALNLVIIAGPEQGYETTIPEAFEHHVLLGVLIVTMLIGGPVMGIIVTRRARERRRRSAP